MAAPDAILQQARNEPDEPNAPDATLAANAQLGQLADATPDTMSLHTKDAYRIFTGRGADAAGKLQPIPGRQALCGGSQIHLALVGERQSLRRLDPDPHVRGSGRDSISSEPRDHGA
jgi:hypothetical protein